MISVLRRGKENKSRARRLLKAHNVEIIYTLFAHTKVKDLVRWPGLASRGLANMLSL